MRTAILPLLLFAGIAHAAAPISFVLMGDSTTAPAGGWGDGFCADVTSGTGCFNHGKSGATTGSFVAGGYFAASLADVKAEVAKGNRVLATMQFGHNDQKIADPESMGKNLTAMVAQIRAVSGEPVLITSLSRRNFFSNGTVDDILGPWADETILIAQQQKTVLLDLHKASLTYVQELGATASHRLNLAASDNTHLNPQGEIVFARMVADLFDAAYTEALPIVPNAALSYNISHGIPSY